MWGIGRLVTIALALAVTALALRQYAVRWHPATDRYPVQGIDVDESVGTVDWNAVSASGADFAYARATNGARHRDAAFEANWQGIAAAGLRRGALLRYSLCQPATEQANAFNTFVPQTPDALPPAIEIAYVPGCDARPDRAVLVADLRRMIATVETHMRMPALLKVSPDVEDDYRLSEVLPRTIWATGNFRAPDYTVRPWRMWQASDMRRIEGIEGPVRWNVAART